MPDWQIFLLFAKGNVKKKSRAALKRNRSKEAQSGQKHIFRQKRLKYD